MNVQRLVINRKYDMLMMSDKSSVVWLKLNAIKLE